VSQRPHPAVLASLIAVMVGSWSINFVIGKVALRHFAPLTLATFRVTLAALIMLPIYAISRLAGARTRAFDRRDFWTFGYLGLLSVGVNQVCFTVGLNYTTVGHSALILGMGPVVILLLARLLGLEALTAKKALGMAIAFAGVTVLAAEHGLSLRSGTLRGDLITFAGSLGFAVYTVLGKKVAAEYDSVSMNTFNCLVGAIVLLPLTVHEAIGFSRSGGWGQVAWEGWAALGFMAGFASVVAYLIYYWALRYLLATRLAAFSYVQPVLSTGLGVGLLGEQLTSQVVLGGGLVLLGVYQIERGPREHQLEEIHITHK